MLRFENLIGLIHPEDRTRVIAEFARAEQAEGSFKDEFRVVIPGGVEQCVAAFDITERKGPSKTLKRRWSRSRPSQGAAGRREPLSQRRDF